MSTVREQQPGAALHHEGRRRWVGLAMLSVGISLIIVDATIVNVSVPSIIKDLKLDSSTAEWVNSVYSLVFASLLVTAGRMGDTLGRRRLYLTGLTVFMVASVLAGFAPSGAVLIAARIVQGVGGAMILPATTSILNANFQGKDRAIAFGIWGSVIGGMAAVGPLLGGALTTYLSWRYAFYINIPIGLFALAGTLHYVRESRDEDAHLGFDPLGFVLITGGLAALVYGLIEGRSDGWWTPLRQVSAFGVTWPSDTVAVTPFALGGGLLALVLFAVVESRRKRTGAFILMDFTLWKERGFRYGNLAGTIVSLGEFGLLFALPLFVQSVLGYSAFMTGLAFLSLALGSFVSAGGAAPLSKARGPRAVVRLGMLLETVGIITSVLVISRTTSGWVLAMPLFVYGLGVGFASAQLASITLGGVPVERSGIASGTNSTMRQVGSALGIAILGTVLFSSLTANADANLAKGVPAMSATCRGQLVQLVDATAGQVLPSLKSPSAGMPTGMVGTSGSASCFADPAFRADIPAAIAPIEQGYVDAAKAAGIVAGGFVFIGFIMTLLLPDRRH